LQIYQYSSWFDGGKPFRVMINGVCIPQVWPHSDYPLREVGKLKLDRNPTNYFAEVEQASFSPAHMVPGIEASPDRVLQARLFAYDDAARYRIGSNFLQVSYSLY